MPLRTYQTLAEARRELAQRLGYGADPDAANAGQLTSYLRRAHQTLYERLEWNRRIVDFPFTTAAGVWRYDYPSVTTPGVVMTTPAAALPSVTYPRPRSINMRVGANGAFGGWESLFQHGVAVPTVVRLLADFAFVPDWTPAQGDAGAVQYRGKIFPGGMRLTANHVVALGAGTTIGSLEAVASLAAGENLTVQGRSQRVSEPPHDPASATVAVDVSASRLQLMAQTAPAAPATPEGVFHADPDRIRSARVQRGAHDVVRMDEGFDLYEFSSRDQLRSWPQRYRRREQLEIWPTPDGAYTITLEAYTLAPALIADTDPLVVPDDVVLADALYHAQIDRGSPANPALLAQRDTRVREIRARAHGDRTYVQDGAGARAAAPRPRVA